MKCPKCQDSMELGVVGDAIHTGTTSPVWYSGAIDGSLFVATKNRRAIYVQTMRCKRCGYLESYALDPGQEDDQEP